MDLSSDQIKKTPLHSRHVELKARMAPFAGYDMPISYDETSGGMLKEHLAVRQSVGIFDVSHMGEFWLRGPQATEFLSFMCTRGFAKLADGKAQYCLLLNERGTIVDDIIVYKMNAETYWVVVNAANLQKDFEHLSKHIGPFNAHLQNVSDETGLIAIQGPKAVELVAKFLPEALALKYYGFLTTKAGWICGRTGYTGEDGFEIFLPADQTLALWMKLESLGAVPIGLGARDTLRLEVGFPLYGHELSDELFPMETASAFAVDLNNVCLGHAGASQPPRYKPIALWSRTPKPIRAEELVFKDGRKVGWVTSGSTSPIKRLGMALALVEKNIPTLGQTEEVFMLESAGKQRESVLTSTPFVATARVKGAKPVAKV